MKDNFLTVDKLKQIFDSLSESGYGDMKIKCRDGYLHSDEITYDYMQREILFRGMIYNFSPTEKVKRFNMDIQKAYVSTT